MPADIAVVKKACIEHTGESQATDSYGTLVATPKIKDGDYTDQILSSDAKFFNEICNNPFHPRRKDFIAVLNTGIAYGGEIATHVGPIESVVFNITGGKYNGAHTITDYWPAEMREELEIENENIIPLKSFKPHAIVDGDTVLHNAAGLIRGGASAVTVDVRGCAAYARTAACQSPAELTGDIADDATGTLLNKDGSTGGVPFTARAEATLAKIAAAGRKS